MKARQMLKLRTARAEQPTIDVLLVTYKARRWLDGFLAGLLGSDYPQDKIRLIVVDNASQDDCIDYLQESRKRSRFVSKRSPANATTALRAATKSLSRGHRPIIGL